MKNLISDLFILVLAVGIALPLVSTFDPQRLRSRGPRRSHRRSHHFNREGPDFFDKAEGDSTTTENPDDSTDSALSEATTYSSYDEDNFELSRNRAIHNALFKVLQALGPKFKEGLPSPTNATLTPFNSTIKVVGSEACPDYYKRCSSQTFYPSCEVPRNTDPLMWNQRFTLYFNISSEISTISPPDVLNATLRLYKNLSLPLNNPNTLIVKLHAFNRTLRRNRERSREISSTRVASDYVGWVFLDVRKLIRRLKGPANYGIKITVQNEYNVPWNVPDLFVKMDCTASNETLIPLPFEVMQLENETQRYPALNIRSGSLESIEDNDYYDEVNADYANNNNNNNFEKRDRQRQNSRAHSSNNYGGYNYGNVNYGNNRNPNFQVQESPNYYGDDTSAENNVDGLSSNIWSTNGAYDAQPFRDNSGNRSPRVPHNKQPYNLVASIAHEYHDRNSQQGNRENFFDYSHENLDDGITDNPETDYLDKFSQKEIQRNRGHRNYDFENDSQDNIPRGNNGDKCKLCLPSDSQDEQPLHDIVSNDEPYPDYTDHSNRIHSHELVRPRHSRRHFRRHPHRRHHSRRHHSRSGSFSSHHDGFRNQKFDDVVFEGTTT